MASQPEGVEAGGPGQIPPGDWARLQRLRRLFLGGEAGGADYWREEADLAAYDRTFAQRIAWKWSAALAALSELGWTPPPGGGLLDWGCGSGVAGRAVLDAFAPGTFFSRLALWDRSPLAVAYAGARARERFPGLEVAADASQPVSTLVLSHVVNELDAPARHALLGVLSRAQAVLWVEPGAQAESRALGAIREEILGGASPAGGGWRVVAPCPHGGGCGMLRPGAEGHWCHFHGRPPVNAFTDPGWARFGKEMGIDLRAVPYSWLALDRRPPGVSGAGSAPAGARRLIGRPEALKAATRAVLCGPDAVVQEDLPRRAYPELHRAARHCREVAWVLAPEPDAG